MQTFITAQNSSWGVENLDNLRLNKQLLEARQIMKVLLTVADNPNAKIGWKNHPAVLMWSGYEMALLDYSASVTIELGMRNISWQNNWSAIIDLIDQYDAPGELIYPYWWIDPIAIDKLITSHRATLYHKDSEFYAHWRYDYMWIKDHPGHMLCCTGPKRICKTYWPSHEKDHING